MFSAHAAQGVLGLRAIETQWIGSRMMHSHPDLAKGISVWPHITAQNPGDSAYPQGIRTQREKNGTRHLRKFFIETAKNILVILRKLALNFILS